jgi:hypothetical protein
VTRAALAIAVLLAWALGRRVPSSRQRAIAATLTGLLAVDVARLVSRPCPVAHVALFALWYVVTAWGVVVVLNRETPGIVPAASKDPGGCTSPPVLLEVGRPRILPDRGPVASAALQIALVLAGLFVAATLAVYHGSTMALERAAFWTSLIAQGLAGAWAALFGAWPRREDLAAWLTAWILICSSVVDALAGPWAVAQPVRDWYISHWISGATWLLAGAVQLWILLRKPTES